MRMLKSIRCSVLCKCFRFFLLGYFLLSTINISGNLYHHCNHETKICSFFDKMFKWNKYSNELEETKTKEAKGVKFVKEISVLEFLIPYGTSLNSYLFQNTLSKKFNLDNPVFLFGFCREIHLPPPQFFV